MIKALLSGIFKLIISLVNLLLLPIDTLISNYLPSLSEALEYITQFFEKIGELIPFAISYFGLNTIVLSIIVAIMTFILTVPLLVNTVKLALAWYNKLKP